MSECKHPVESRFQYELKDFDADDMGTCVTRYMWGCVDCGKGRIANPIAELAERVAHLERFAPKPGTPEDLFLNAIERIGKP